MNLNLSLEHNKQYLLAKGTNWVCLAICVLMAFCLCILSGCTSPRSPRQTGEFPNIPELMDSLPNLTDEEYAEVMNLTEEDGTTFMHDLDGWHEFPDIYLEIKDNDKKSLKLWVGDLNLASTENYFVLDTGIVIESTYSNPFDGGGKTIADLTVDPYLVEEILAKSIMESSIYGQEDEVAKELLLNCGIDVEADGYEVDQQQYTKTSPLDAIMSVISEDARAQQFGSTYCLVGETSTPSGKPLYYKVDVAISDLVLSIQPSLGYPSYLSISKSAHSSLIAEFRLNDPFELTSSDNAGAVSSSPINDESVFLWMANEASSFATSMMSEETSAAKSSPSLSRVYYKADSELDQCVYTLTIEDDGSWLVSFQAIVDGSVPATIGGDINGQGISSGSFAENGNALAEDGAVFDVLQTNDGLTLQCIDGVTLAAADVEGTYYSDLSKALR